ARPNPSPRAWLRGLIRSNDPGSGDSGVFGAAGARLGRRRVLPGCPGWVDVPLVRLEPDQRHIDPITGRHAPEPATSGSTRIPPSSQLGLLLANVRAVPAGTSAPVTANQATPGKTPG